MTNDSNTCNDTKTCTDAALCTTESALPVARPRVDGWVTDEGLQLYVEVPGVAPDAVELTGEGDRLTLRAAPATAAAGDGTVHREWRPVRFERTFEISSDFDVQAATARIDAGVLEVTVPKRATAKPRRIEIDVRA